MLGVAAFVALLFRNVRQPSPVRSELTSAVVAAEDAQLRAQGLTLPTGGVFRQRPFDEPFTRHSLLIPPDWFGPPLGMQMLLGKESVRASDLLADLAVLEAVMQRAYGGWDRAAARGWSWDTWFSAWRRELTAYGESEIRFGVAFAPVSELLRFQRDNHTQIPLSRMTLSPSQTALLATPPGGACTEIVTDERRVLLAGNDAGQRVRTARRWTSSDGRFEPASYIVLPVELGMPQRIHCGDEWIALAKVGTPKNASPTRMLLAEIMHNTGSDRPHVERIGDGVVYARLPSFDPSTYAGFDTTTQPKRLPGDRVLVIDLRDNGGGAYEYGLSVLAGWVDPARFIAQTDMGRSVTTSCLYTPLKWGFYSRFFDMTALDADARTSFQELLDGMSQPDPTGCPRTMETTPARWTYGARRFAPRPDDLRLVVLVNARCGSDCEALTFFLASLTETLVVGANTFGLGQFVEPGYSVLPRTGLAYRIALGVSDMYGDDRSVDGYGLDVDVVLPEVDTLTKAQMQRLGSAVLAYHPQ